ncbi:MAG TPA: serine/threonine-protein kinase [Kofleriaceae bacterium]|nr:serine/threonine-protein kinase [Kofleriaceae bacterium]
MEGKLDSGVTLLGKYRVEKVLGRGGMGVVLKVRHVHLGEELALKVLLPENAISQEVTARFLREAQSAVRLRGEHIARIIDVGVLPEGLPFIVMEYLAGTDLSGELTRRGTLPPGEAVDYVLHACEALAEAHANQIVHRDIKPANLFLTTRPDGTPTIKVLDFGISKAPLNVSEMVTRTEIVMGTPGYMSPEQMRASRDVDVRTDIWALGVVLYECLCGRRPFVGESFSAIVLMAGTQPPPPMSARIPRGLQAAVLRCLEKERGARFPSIAALAAALGPFARNQHEATTIVERTSLIVQRPRRDGGYSAASPPPASPTTTLSNITGIAITRAPSRRAIAVVFSVLGAAAVLTVSALVTSGLWRPVSEAPVLDPGPTTNGDPLDGSALHTHIAAPPGSRDGSSAGGSRADLGERDPQPGEQKAAACGTLVTQMRWRAVADCASELDKLGDSADAERFHKIATLESESEAIDRKVRRALGAQKLREAQTLLTQIPEGSVYRAPLNALFEQSEASRAGELATVVARYVKIHDCAGLRRVMTHALPASGTQRITEFLEQALASCAEVVAAPSAREHGARKATGGAQQSPSPRSGPSSDDEPVIEDDGGADGTSGVTPPKPDTSRKGVASVADGDSGTTQDSSAHPDRAGCDTSEVDGTVEQAKSQFNAGNPATALSLMRVALECRQSVLMHRLAGLYACRAHDVGAARQYFNRIPAQFQPALEQICQLEGIKLRTM